MNDQQIYLLIAKIPKIRAVQVADALDAPLEDATGALDALIAVGDLVASSGFSPNGMACTLYDFSDEFRRSKEHRALLSMLPAAENDMAGLAGLSQVNRAIEFVRRNGVATTEQLHNAMGLADGQYVSRYLGAAVRTGKLSKDGRDYMLGHGAPRAAKPARAPKPKMHVVPPVPAADEFIEVPEPQPMAPDLRCAVWSDGVVELQRGGVPVVAMSEAEADFIAAFRARLGVQRVAA